MHKYLHLFSTLPRAHLEGSVGRQMQLCSKNTTSHQMRMVTRQNLSTSVTKSQSAFASIETPHQDDYCTRIFHYISKCHFSLTPMASGLQCTAFVSMMPASPQAIQNHFPKVSLQFKYVQPASVCYTMVVGRLVLRKSSYFSVFS